MAAISRPERDEFAPDGEVVDDLGVVARREGRDRGAGEAGEVGGAAEFLQPLVILEEGLQRHRRGERVLRDVRGARLEDPRVDGLVEMLGLQIAGDAVEDVVVGQDRAEKLLLGLDVVGQVQTDQSVRDRHKGLDAPDLLIFCFPPWMRHLRVSPMPRRRLLFLWITLWVTAVRQMLAPR